MLYEVITFVRGDAIAGLLITGINVIGGMIIGMAQNDLTFSQAADMYTRLTVGDGLVSQIPALIVSVAAGIIVITSYSIHYTKLYDPPTTRSPRRSPTRCARTA